MANGGPLGVSVPLSAELLDAIGEERRALAQLRKELSEVEAQARATLSAGGTVDEALEGRRGSLRASVAGLQTRINDFTQLRESRLEQKRREREDEARAEMVGAQMHYLRGAMSRFGLTGGTVAKVVGAAVDIAALPGTLGSIMQLTSEKGGRAAAVGQALSAFGKTAAKAARGAVMGPVGAVLVAAELSENVLENWRRATAAEGEVRKREAQAFFSLTGGPPLNVMDTGSAGQAQRVHRALESSRAAALAINTTITDRVANPFWISAKQLDRVGRYQQHAERVEGARQRLDLSYDPESSPAVHQQAWRKLKFRMLTDFGVFKAAAEGLLSGRSPLEQLKTEYRDDVIRSVEHNIESQNEARSTLVKVSNAGLFGAIRRTKVNEASRHQRAIEADRIARWNAWSMS